MAGIRKLKGYYYARVWIKGKEKTIPLKTNQIRQASIRRSEVEKYEAEIRAGIDINFPWIVEGKQGVHQTSLSKAIELYIESRKSDQIREQTIQIYTLALNHFKVAIGNFNVEEITIKQIDIFKSHFKNVHSKTTININLRAIKTFLVWLAENGYIDRVPRIKMLNGQSDIPIYLSNEQFNLILITIDNHPKVFDSIIKEVFILYRDTGMRLSELFYGELEGNFLHIASEVSKTHYSRDIYLTDKQIELVKYLQLITHFPGDSTEYIKIHKTKTHEIKHYSKQFQKACKLSNITGRKFHCLRHTFAVRKYLEYGDIYKVAKLMGHRSVKTTEIYAKFNQRKLEQDFPDLVKNTQTGNESPVTVE